IAIIVALKPTSRPKKINDYFLYERNLSPSGFVKTSVGYSMQVVSIFLFLLWTLEYGAISFLIPLSWCFGYFLMGWAVSRKLLDDFLVTSDLDEIRTIHGFIGSKVNRGRLFLVSLMAIFTIFGLGGTLVAEMDYVTLFISQVLGFGQGGFTPYLIHMVILIFTVFYVLWGGYRAVVETDKFQVPLSYISFAIILFAIFYYNALLGNVNHSRILTILCILIFFVILRNRITLSKLESDYPILRDKILLSIILIIGLITLLFTFGKENTTPITWIGFFKENNHLFGFGLFGIISLFIANSIWQFVDISSLQRLQSVEYSSEQDSKLSTHSRIIIKQGLFSAGIESAIIWILAIFLALGLHFAGIQGYDDLSNFFMSLGGVFWWILPLFVFAMISFMLSSIDGFISAISYVTYYDVLRQQEVKDNKDQRHLLARITTFFSVFIIYTLYIFLKEGPAAQHIAAILYVVYAVQISIACVIIITLLKPKYINVSAAILSILSGGVVSWWTATTYDTPFKWIPLDSWYVIPPLAVFIFSTFTYIIVYYSSSILRKLNIKGI
ncbi:hypothetical protein ACFL6G_10205, partial [candidate division KSB1 bacterium]